MAQEIQKPTKLAICGKIVNIEKIKEKTLGQFKNQLRLSGITLPDAELEALYTNLTQEPETPAEEQK